VNRTSTPIEGPVASDADDVLTAFRAEWKNGVNGYYIQRKALPALRRLRALAPSGEADRTISDLIRRLEDYRTLMTEERKRELVEVAEIVKTLQPVFQRPAEQPRQIGKLNEAVAPGRAASRPTAPKPAVAPKQFFPSDPVTKLPKIGDAVAKKLEHLNVHTVGDLLYLRPRRHIDYSNTLAIGSLLAFNQPDEVTVGGEIIDIRQIPGPTTSRVVMRISDGTGWVRATWFGGFIAKQLQTGDRIAISGLVDLAHGAPSFTQPEWERIGGPSLSTGRLTPVYPLTQGLAQKTLRNFTRAALDATESTVIDFLPESVRQARGLMPLRDALEATHYPASQSELEAAQERLAFDNLLLLQLGLLKRKHASQSLAGNALPDQTDVLRAFFDSLPFTLTQAQVTALHEILADMSAPRPMNRLLQGDVGSGKTVVAAAAALRAVASGFQAAVMAPTEILAEQHDKNFRSLYAGLSPEVRPTIELLTGTTPAKKRAEIAEGLLNGSIDVVIGTHALIQETVAFANLGFVVIDEQHRFGVRQRNDFSDKARGARPHHLAMTATPIPRTLNMVVHGDLDVSIIDELPPGRIPIETRRFHADERREAYDLIRREIRSGRQAFVICPLVEESETSEAKAVTAEAERLQNEVFPDLRVSMLHGRMSGKEKEQKMAEFHAKEKDILVSTSVIEVGIDVPNATVMMIEGADRFGLAQLHQFRGRVGRGGNRSYCLLLADEVSADGDARLQIMEESNDGFALADKDLELRGPGDFVGTRQSGMPELSWLARGFDSRLLNLARESAERLLAVDPGLSQPENRALGVKLDEFWSNAAPDIPLT
jgi:ATP-dependent DNA helicase RecG